MRIGCDSSRRAAGRLEWPHDDECCDRQKYCEDEYKESCQVSALIAVVVVHVISVKIRRLLVDTHCHPGSTKRTRAGAVLAPTRMRRTAVERTIEPEQDYRFRCLLTAPSSRPCTSAS